MMRANLVHELLAVVEAAPLDEPEGFVSVSLALLALAVSRLPPVERENVLRAVEELGALRKAVQQFPDPHSPLPKVTTNGNGKGKRFPRCRPHQSVLNVRGT